MKKTNLMFMLILALTTSVASAQLTNSGATKTERPERAGNPQVQAARGELKEARGALRADRAENKAAMGARRAETKEMREDSRAAVAAGEMTKEEAKAAGEARKAENKAAGVAARAERAAARDGVVDKRKSLIDTRIASVREKSPEMADTMANYYGQIMAKVEGMQGKRDEIIAAVEAGNMTGAEARAEFKSYVEAEKAAIKALIAEMKEEVKAMRAELKASRNTDTAGQ